MLAFTSLRQKFVTGSPIISVFDNSVSVANGLLAIAFDEVLSDTVEAQDAKNIVRIIEIRNRILF